MAMLTALSGRSRSAPRLSPAGGATRSTCSARPAGASLALAPPAPPMIPPGQIVRMGTPAGAKIKGRLFYLVAVPMPVTVIQLDTIRFVPVVVTPQPGKVIITIPGTASGGQVRDTDLAFSP